MRKGLLRRLTWRAGSLIALETCLICAAVALAAYLRLGAEALEFIEYEWFKWLLVPLVTQVCLYYVDLYDLQVISARRELFGRAINALGATSLILAGIYYWFPELVIGRGVFILTALLVITLVFGWRVVFEWANRHVAPRERLLLVGTSEGAVKLAKELYERRNLGVDIVGFIDPDPNRIGLPVLNPGVLGTIEDIPTVARALGVDRVVVSLADARGKLPMDKLLEMRLDGVAFDHLASVYEEYTGKIAVESLRPSWLIFAPGFAKGRLLRTMKRLMDVAAGALGILLALPLALAAVIGIKSTSPGPVFYRQRRVGQHGRVFLLYKFRSMRTDAESATGAVWATRNDARITPFGRFLRKTRIDEIPQLWNVLRGDMSLVGPRPERPEFVTALTRDIPFYGQRHMVKPGVTGWAQVSYNYADSVEATLEKLQYDLFYIKNLSLTLDLFIIFKTVKTVLMRKGAQ
jgi:sugar transferase (PEP-CTERM system associated)